MERLTIDSLRWPEFVVRLHDELRASGCDPGQDRPLARRVLETMGADVEETLAYFDAEGGGCDCEILLNVDR